jgi:hypothetical protein
MRAIGLVLLSIAIMVLLLTEADAKRRSSAQGSQAAGAGRSWCATSLRKGINDNCVQERRAGRGARKASEIVMLTCRTLHLSRAAICSKLNSAGGGHLPHKINDV